MAKQDGPTFKGYPSLPLDKLKYVVDFYDHQLHQHFEKTEHSLLPKLKGIDPNLDQLINRTEAGQIFIAGMIQECKNVAYDTDSSKIAALDAFGRHFETHIRMVERELFQTAQEVAADVLNSLTSQS